MIKKILGIAIGVIMLSSCSNSNNFTISKDTVGPLATGTKVSELKTVFVNDSLVDQNGNEEFVTSNGDITVYEKGGKKLLKLSPSSDDTNTIKFIQIFDDRYITEKGISLNSTFKDIQDAYTLKRIDNLLGTIVIFVNDGNEYFTIDKKHLSANLMFDTETKIEATQIPDEAPIKYLMIGW